MSSDCSLSAKAPGYLIEVVGQFVGQEFRGAAPAPVALRYARGVHPAIAAETEQILQRGDGQGGC